LAKTTFGGKPSGTTNKGKEVSLNCLYLLLNAQAIKEESLKSDSEKALRKEESTPSAHPVINENPSRPRPLTRVRQVVRSTDKCLDPAKSTAPSSTLKEKKPLTDSLCGTEKLII